MECVGHDGLVWIVEPSSRERSPYSLSEDVQRLGPHFVPRWLIECSLSPHFSFSFTFFYIILTQMYSLFSIFLTSQPLSSARLNLSRSLAEIKSRIEKTLMVKVLPFTFNLLILIKFYLFSSFWKSLLIKGLLVFSLSFLNIYRTK